MTQTEDTDFGRELIASMQEAAAIMGARRTQRACTFRPVAQTCALYANAWA